MHSKIKQGVTLSSQMLVVLALIGLASTAPLPAAASTEPNAIADLAGSSSPVVRGKIDRAGVKALINSLETAPRRSPGTYDREAQYGTWSTKSGSADASFCGSTREDIRNRDLKGVEYSPSDSCEVEHGSLSYDPYSGDSLVFSRQANPDLEVEHFVPAEYHYDMLGHDQTQGQREAFFNDPDNLALVSASANSAKGSKGPADWLVPDNPGYVCTYIARFSYIAAKYDMPITPADRDALLKNVATCDNSQDDAASKQVQSSSGTATAAGDHNATADTGAPDAGPFGSTRDRGLYLGIAGFIVAICIWVISRSTR